jgi:hypothetical protein
MTLNFDINDISYGNMSYENRLLITQDSSLVKYFSEFTSAPFPKNNSSEVEYELRTILEEFNKASRSEKLRYYKAIDQDLYKVIGKFLVFYKIATPENITAVMTCVEKLNLELAPLILKLKEHYQRPRPYQLAPYYNIPLYPYESNPALSPAYPSGHTLTAYFVCGLISEIMPEKTRLLESLADVVATSRISMGVHFPSDNKFSIAIAEHLIEKPEVEVMIKELEKVLKSSDKK